MPSESVLIIGAGVAGLAAARELGRAGREVVILEARNRIGGRVFTYKDPDSPVPIELGAEFVHGKSPELWQMARAANLKLYEVSGAHWYFEDGKISKSREFWRKIEGLMREMKSSKSDRSFKDFLDSLPDDEGTDRARAMAIRYVEGFDAANIERIGVRGLIKENEASDQIDGDKIFRLLRGYNSLTRALRAEAESYGATIHLDCIVRQIRLSGDHVEVTCEDAETFSALQAIITLPLGVLQASPDETAAVRFIPELPERKRAAIHNLAMGNVLKINLHFRERFWESVKVWDADAQRVSFADAGFFHCPGAPFPTWWTQLPIRAPLLVGWTGGPNAERYRTPTGRGSEWAMQESGDPAILDQAVASLSTIFDISPDDLRGQLEASYMHNWRDDPFSRGAYAYVPVNGLESQRILSEPINNKLFFAGEATSVGHIGTVHGAIQSGQRAAKEILST